MTIDILFGPSRTMKYAGTFLSVLVLIFVSFAYVIYEHYIENNPILFAGLIIVLFMSIAVTVQYVQNMFKYDDTADASTKQSLVGYGVVALFVVAAGYLYLKLHRNNQPTYYIRY